MRYYTICFVLLGVGLAMLQAGCDFFDSEKKNDRFPEGGTAFMEVDASTRSIGVGLDTPVVITVAVTKDAKDETCSFTATSGSFSETDATPSVDVIVDVNGQAKAFWFAPDEPGLARLTTTINSVSDMLDIEVTPVPSVELNDVPDSLAVGEQVLFRTKVDADWANKPMEIRAPNAVLQATGPVDQELDMGSRILPLTDEQGEVAVVFTAPSMPLNIQITASLFGTRESKLVKIFEPTDADQGEEGG